MLEQTRANKDNFTWTHIASISALEQLRMEAMHRFLDDFSTDSKRYVNGQLPILELPNKHFDLALCSHLLFLYSEQLDRQFHLDAVLELCRVAKETRIFPLLALNGQHSEHLDVVLSALKNLRYSYLIEEVEYEFQKKGNQMLRIWGSEC